MNLEDLSITDADSPNIHQPGGILTMLERIQRDKAFQGAPRGKVIYLYDQRTGTTIAKPYGKPDDHLGSVED